MHLDIAEGYSTDSFMICLRRFVGIRGYLQKILSDRGSQLICASQELTEITKEWNWNHIHSLLLSIDLTNERRISMKSIDHLSMYHRCPKDLLLGRALLMTIGRDCTDVTLIHYLLDRNGTLPCRNVCEDDIVLLEHLNSIRAYWKIAEVDDGRQPVFFRAGNVSILN